MSADPKMDRTVQRASVVVLIVIAVLTAAGLTYAYTLQADAAVPAEEPCLAAIDTSDRTHALYQELVEISAETITAAGDWGTTTLTRNADRAAELDTELAQAFDTYATHAEDCRAIPATEGPRP